MRFIKICSTFCKYLVFYKLTAYRQDGFGKRLRLAFEELGITLIKIGQILSMRYDLLLKEDCLELQQLLDKVKPVPIGEIYSIIQKEYGKPYDQVFKRFYWKPIGSASVSQVYKAETFDGQIVVVKIKRPNVGAKFSGDIKILKRLAAIGQFFSGTLRHMQTRSLVNYFEAWIKQDMDFITEVKNMKRVKKEYEFGEENLTSDLGKGRFPLPVESLCKENIIVMDFIEGIPMSRKEEILANPKYNAEKSIRTYVAAAVQNWLRQDRPSYVFQADPHLSNILALPGGDAANIDCGLIAELTKQETQEAKDLVIAVYLQDLNRTLKVACKMTGVPYEKYAPILRPQIEVYLEKTKTEGFGFWFLEFAKIMVKNKIKFPLYLTTFGRTNVMLDGLVETYIPGHTTLELLGDELQKAVLWETWQNIANVNWARVGYAFSKKLKQSPELIEEVLNNPLKFVSEIANAVRAPAQ